MDQKQFDDVVCVLVGKIKFFSERATTAAEAEALAAVVQALVNFLSVRTSEQGDQQAPKEIRLEIEQPEKALKALMN